MHCYVINLPTAVARRGRVAHELETCCPDVPWSVPRMFVAGDMTDAQLADVYDSKRAWELHGYEMSRGEIACALSHQSALRTFLGTDAEACLIVEDDVVFSPAVGRFLKSVEVWFSGRRTLPLCIMLSEASAIRLWNAKRMDGEFRLSKVIDGCGAIAYVANRKGAETILNANAIPLTTTSDDWAFYKRNGLVLLGVDRVLAGSSDFGREDSSLSEGRRMMYEAMRGRRTRVPFLFVKIRAACAHLKLLWWWASGVDRKGENRSNERLYLMDRRKDVSL